MVFKVWRGSEFRQFLVKFWVGVQEALQGRFFRYLAVLWTTLGPTGRDFGASWGPLGGPFGVQWHSKTIKKEPQIQRVAQEGQKEGSRGDLGVVWGSFLEYFSMFF